MAFKGYISDVDKVDLGRLIYFGCPLFNSQNATAEALAAALHGLATALGSAQAQGAKETPL